MINEQKYKLAPIVLFAYNRPEHTEKTLEALRLNTLAPESILYVYCDGPVDSKDEDVLAPINEVYKIVNRKQWCGKVNIIKSAINKGLAESIKHGVTDIVSKYGKVIVLEDDLITSTAFLTYMNEALNYYQNFKSVFSVSAYCLPKTKFQVPEDYNYDVFAALRNSSWGWGTWTDRWEQVDWEVREFRSIKENIWLKDALNRGGDDVFDLLQMQQNGTLNIWSIQFTLAHFIHHAVSIVPTESYVDNIGHDGSGINCYERPDLQHLSLCENEDIKFLDIIYQDKRIINAFYNAYCRKKRPLWKKITNRLSRLLGGQNVFILKKKLYQ